MPSEPVCPVCESEEWWSVLVTARQGVRLPGDSRAAVDEETRREIALCSTCGVCYDPVVAAETDENATGTTEVDAAEADQQPPPETVRADADAIRERLDGIENTLQANVTTVHERLDRLENALQVVAGVQAGMANVTPAVDQDRVMDTLSETDVVPDQRK
ncbi:MAG: hypothetical protein ABEI96_01110 [Haloarculaceae archaeon]